MDDEASVRESARASAAPALLNRPGSSASAVLQQAPQTPPPKLPRAPLAPLPKSPASNQPVNFFDKAFGDKDEDVRSAPPSLDDLIAQGKAVVMSTQDLITSMSSQCAF